MQKARRHPLTTRRTSQAPTACMHTVSGSFHSPSGVLFTVPSRYSPLSVTDSYLALEDGPPRFNRDSSCPGLLGCLTSPRTRISPTGLSPPAVRRSRRVRLSFPYANVRSLNPGKTQVPPVWALPRSLAATWGISFDVFSSRYLDVSVPWVRLP